jgi:hypothetical protein
MKVLLHIGMTKAGSSALQEGLAAAQKDLEGRGILYPDRGRTRNSHLLLLEGLVPPERLPRGLRGMYREDFQAMARDRRAWLDELRKVIAKRRCHTLILSEEFLFYVRSEEGLTELRRRLLALAGAVDIEVIAYVRRPSEHYLASVQQRLKGAHSIPGPNPVGYRQAIDGFDAHVADRMHVVHYDRASWVDGDIVRHFLATLLPGAESVVRPGPAVNESLSAEAMSILAEYRSRFWSDQDNRMTPDTNEVVRVLSTLDATSGDARRARLHDHIAQMVDLGSTDLLWLRDTHGITFDGVDYAAIHRPATRHEPLPRVDCICPVDDDRREELLWGAVHHLATAR